jgi:hypothetical protein
MITLELIRSFKPCYDPGKWAAESWSGTVMDVLNANQVPASDRLWLVLREEFIDAKTLRLFACWCAREALKLVKEPDARFLAAVKTAERYAHGRATKEELAAAQSEAWSIVDGSETESAARSADRSPRYAAWSAAWSAKSAVRLSQIEKLKELICLARPQLVSRNDPRPKTRARGAP